MASGANPARKHQQVADFDPRQLDILEDALEDLDQIDDLASLELSPALSERLAAYQDVLALCREAFPLETPSDSVLTGVIAEAHEVSRRPKLRDGLDDGSAWRRFWERWRGTVVPGIALAGTAAAVLFLLEPNMTFDGSSEDLLTDKRQVERAATKPDDSKRSQPASEPAFESKGDAADDAADDVENAAAELGDVQPDPDAEVEEVPQVDPSPRKQISKAHKSKSAAGTEPAVAPAPAPEPMSKDDTWTSLERANAKRRMGSCDRARSIYEEIIAAGSDSLAVARAKAGIGLCFEQDRRASEAATWFDDARAANPGIDAWINTQRDEQPMPGEKKRNNKAQPAPFDADAL
jgi:tetratricopeptide (TPR) repeat protein